MPRVLSSAPPVSLEIPAELDIPQADRDIIRAINHAGQIRRQPLREILIARGHAPSTVGRRIAHLMKQSILVYRCKSYRLTGRMPLASKRNFSRPGVAPNRFGAQSVEKEAAYVREYYIRRLDECFEHPTSALRAVLRCVDRARQLGQSVESGDRDAFLNAARRFREAASEVAGGATTLALLQALQVGLFPESFLGSHDKEVVKSIETDRELKRNRQMEIELISDENEKSRREGRPLIAVAVVEAELPRVQVRGLVPTGGGARVGAARLQCFLKSVLGESRP